MTRIKKYIFILLTAAAAVLLCTAALAAGTDEEENGIVYSVPSNYMCLASDGQAELAGTDGLYQAICSALTRRVSQLDLSSYDLSDSGVVGDTFTTVLRDHAELFYVMPSCFIWSNSSGLITKLEPQYTADGENPVDGADPALQAVIDEFDGYVSDITSLVGSGWTDLEKALFLHDYLDSHFEYDRNYLSGNTADIIFSPLEFLRQHMGVCQAYAETYRLLLTECGVPSKYAASTAMNHIWNLVQIGGSWYHVDVTWDDPLMSGKADSFGHAKHNYFLLSDAAIFTGTSAGDHHDWAADDGIVCTSTAYDSSYWRGVVLPFQPVGSTWYYSGISYGVSLYATSDPAAAGTYVDKVLPNYFYTGLAACDGKLYYNSDTAVYVYNPADKTSAVLFTNTNAGALSGLYVEDGTMTYVTDANHYDVGALGTYTYALRSSSSTGGYGSAAQAELLASGSFSDGSHSYAASIYDDGTVDIRLAGTASGTGSIGSFVAAVYDASGRLISLAVISASASGTAQLDMAGMARVQLLALASGTSAPVGDALCCTAA